MKQLDFKARGEKIRYEYVLTEVTDTAFVGEARGTGEMAGDIWRINDKNELTNTVSKCGP
jgi:hypothetical protein